MANLHMQFRPASEYEEPPMRTLGTPLSANDLLRFGALLLDITSRVIRDEETLKYWLRHTGEFESLTREFALKPGRRVLRIDRSAKPVCYEGMQVTRQDRDSAAIEDIDLAQIRYIRYNEFSPQRHVHLDAYALATLLRRREALPKHLLKWPSSRPINFLGTEFQDLKKNNGYVWVSCWYSTHEWGTMSIVGSGLSGEALIAILLKD